MKARATAPPDVAKIALQATCAAILGYPYEAIPPHLRESLDRTLDHVAAALQGIGSVGPEEAPVEKPTTVPGKVARLSEYLDSGGWATARAYRRKRR
ncbi:MAG TPA: hypothetical protein VLT87_11065 [Thermoanaerobaculia bacterium]|nr:hypothetical protein [Thermoanaerobaculia bacterium]